MPRKARIDYPGLTHHIMARTFSEWKLFTDENDKTAFFALLESSDVSSTKKRSKFVKCKPLIFRQFRPASGFWPLASPAKPAWKIERIKEEIRSFRKKLVQIIGAEKKPGRVYHIAMQFFSDQRTV